MSKPGLIVGVELLLWISGRDSHVVPAFVIPFNVDVFVRRSLAAVGKSIYRTQSVALQSTVHFYVGWNIVVVCTIRDSSHVSFRRPLILL
jgi:hypothetical protein